jgi:hypothetical protein
MTDTNDSHRRTVLRTLGAVAALFGVSSAATAHKGPDGHDDDDHDHDDDLKAPTPAEPEEDVGEETSIRFDAQVTDGTYVVAEDVVVPTAGFLSIHQSNTVVDGEEFDYINTEDGSPRNAAQTIVGFSEYLKPGIYDEVKVEIYQDDDLPPVAASSQHRLEDPAVLLALMHVDGNDNEQWDLFDNEDIVDAAYDFGDTEFVPPFDRPDDVAAVVPLEENEDVFEISK